MSESSSTDTLPPTAPRRPPPDPSWRDRVDALLERSGIELSPARIALVAVAVVAAIAVGVIVLRPASSSQLPDATLPRASSPPTDATSTPTTAGHLVVQAAGAVAAPGVYRVAADARVNDLVAMAGGFAPDADPDQVELAATLTDGQRVYVPRVGEALLPTNTSSGSTSDEPHAPVDLNRATVTDLEALPGIGPALAQAIVDYRSQNGAFASVDELGEVRGIGPAKTEQLRSLVKV